MASPKGGKHRLFFLCVIIMQLIFVLLVFQHLQIRSPDHHWASKTLLRHQKGNAQTAHGTADVIENEPAPHRRSDNGDGQDDDDDDDGDDDDAGDDYGDDDDDGDDDDGDDDDGVGDDDVGDDDDGDDDVGDDDAGDDDAGDDDGDDDDLYERDVRRATRRERMMRGRERESAILVQEKGKEKEKEEKEEEMEKEKKEEEKKKEKKKEEKEKEKKKEEEEKDEEIEKEKKKKAEEKKEKVVYVIRSPASAAVASSQCPLLRHRPVKVRETFQFQRVDGLRMTFVFSAFHDERDQVIRVIAISDVTNRPTYFCHLWYDVIEGTGQPDLVVTSSSIEILGESHGKRLSAAYIHCGLPKEDSLLSNPPVPYAVSVTSRRCQDDDTPPTNVMQVVKSDNPVPLSASPSTKVHNFTVCMKPVNMNYSRAHEAVEFIEMCRLLGASKFQVYLQSLRPNVMEVLRWYQAQGIVELIDWPIDKHMRIRQWPPSPIEPEIHAFGQIASSNDCVYRNRKWSRHVVLADWDELLVPRKQRTWTELLHFLHQRYGRPATAYSFACLFFRKDFPPRHDPFPGKDLALRYRSNALLLNRRERSPVPFPARAKYIADPEQIHVAGIHYVLKYRGSSSSSRSGGGGGGKDRSPLMEIQIPVELGAVYHYRDWERPEEYEEKGVQDDDMLRFKDALLERLQHVWSHLPNVSLV